MKKCTAIFMALFLLLTTGCGNGREPYDFYTMSDEQSTVAALFYLGGPDEAGAAVLQEKYFSALPNRWPDGTEMVETEEWQEAYLLLPKCPGTVISIHRLDEEEHPVSELLTTENPVLLHCNRSDVMPSVEVQIQYQERIVIFRPHIRLDSGEIAAADGIYTENSWSAAT